MPWVPPGWVPVGWVPLIDLAAETLATYSALRDQTGAVWYLTAEGLPDGTAAVLALSTSVPPGTDLTPSQPSWLVIESPDGTDWSVYPAPTGEMVASTSAPATGTGLSFLTGLVLTDAAGDAWRVQVTNTGELIALASATIPVTAADTLRPGLPEVATVVASGVFAKSASDTLRPRVSEAPAVVAARVPKSAVDTLRPRVMEAPAVVVKRVVLARTDTLALQVTEAPAVIEEGFTLPPGAIQLPLPQGQLIRGWGR